MSIVELAKLIAEVLDFKNLDPIFVEPRPQEVRYATCSAEKARKILGYQTNYKLRQSIEDMAEWIQKRGPRKFRYHLNVEINNAKTPRTWSERLFT